MDTEAGTSLLDLFDDMLGPFNLIDRIEGLFMALRHGDYGEAAKGGVLGYAGEGASSLAGANTFRFALLRSGNHSLNEVEALLRGYGVRVFGRTHDATCMYFSVKKRQARWAEYVMLQAGVELSNAAFDHRNPGYVGTHDPGWMPAPWSDRPVGGEAPHQADHARQRPSRNGNDGPAAAQHGQTANHPAAVRASDGGGWLERFDSFVDRLAGKS